MCPTLHPHQVSLTFPAQKGKCSPMGRLAVPPETPGLWGGQWLLQRHTPGSTLSPAVSLLPASPSSCTSDGKGAGGKLKEPGVIARELEFCS